MKQIIFLFTLFLLNSVLCQRGQINEQIQSVFGPQTSVSNNNNNNNNNNGPLVGDIIGMRGSFNVIVEPDPIEEPTGPTTAPQTFVKNGIECLCVPYYHCDPTNNTIRPDANLDFGTIDVQYNPDSCQDVLDICCQRAKQTVTPIQPPPVSNRPRGCGIRNVGGLDFKLTNANNYEAGFGEFPWAIALIRIEDEACLCGGSLIHPQVVLTGTHCVHTFQPSQIKIRAGEWDSQTTKERLPYQERVVSQIITHPEFSIRTLANDIALLILNTPVVLDEHINVICLPNQDQIASGSGCFASGWGKDDFGKAGKWSVILKKVPLPIVPSNTCEAELKKTRLTSKFKLHRTFICAGGEAGVDTCQGDGGAPLVCPIGAPNENRYVQNGCVAWGIGCKQRIPAVYTNVATFRVWIDTHMRNLGYDTNVYTY